MCASGFAHMVQGLITHGLALFPMNSQSLLTLVSYLAWTNIHIFGIY